LDNDVAHDIYLINSGVTNMMYFAQTSCLCLSLNETYRSKRYFYFVKVSFYNYTLTCKCWFIL